MSIRLNDTNHFYDMHQALFDIMLDRPQGETLMLLDPGGTDKGSLLRILNLLRMPRSSTLNIAGSHFDFTKIPSGKMVHDLRHNTGMVFRQYSLQPYLAVQQNLIEVPYRVLGLSRDQVLARIEKLLGRLRLKSYSSRYPLHLFDDQQQRVATARTLMMEPQVLLFDKPTAALDPEATVQVVSIIRELAEANIIRVIVIHGVEVTHKIANRVVYVENGHIVGWGDASCLAEP